MGKPRPTDAHFPDNPQLTRALQQVFDLLTDDTVYDESVVVANIAANLAAIALKLQTDTYTERFDSCAHAVDGAWTDIDLSGYGVLEGDICDISVFNWSGGTLTAGVRTDGSGLERKRDMYNFTGWDLRVKAGPSSLIEVWLGNASVSFVYLTGYRRITT